MRNKLSIDQGSRVLDAFTYSIKRACIGSPALFLFYLCPFAASALSSIYTWPSTRTYTNPYEHISFVYLYRSISIYLSIYLRIYLFIYLSIYIYLRIFLFESQSLSPSLIVTLPTTLHKQPPETRSILSLCIRSNASFRFWYVSRTAESGVRPREEPGVRRINDVNPRNGNATSLANSQPPFPLPNLPHSVFLFYRFHVSPIPPPFPLPDPAHHHGPTLPSHTISTIRHTTGPLTPCLFTRFVAYRLLSCLLSNLLQPSSLLLPPFLSNVSLRRFPPIHRSSAVSRHRCSLSRPLISPLLQEAQPWLR